MSRNRNKKTSCLNCHYEFKADENFCPNCSQENHDLKIPFTHIFEEFLENIFHFDNKIWKSLKTLFFYPGRITREFLDGKRVSFVPPIRMFIFFSFLFFFLLNFWYGKVDNKDQKIIDIIKTEVKLDSSMDAKAAMDSIQMEFDGDTTHSSSKEIMLKNKVKKLMSMTREELHALNMKVYTFMSYGLFFLMPILALILMVFYRKSGRFYYEHLITSLHFHAILYIALTMSLVLLKLHLKPLISLVCGLGTLVYFVISLHKVYQNSWRKSIVKGIIIYFMYLFLLSLLAMISAIIVWYNS